METKEQCQTKPRIGRPKTVTVTTEYKSAQVLHRWLYETNVTNKEVAGHLGLRPNMISMMKTGEVKIPIRHIPGIAEAMAQDKEELLDAVLLDHEPELYEIILTTKKKVFSAKELAILQVIREVQRENTKEGDRMTPIVFSNNSLEKLKAFAQKHLI